MASLLLILLVTGVTLAVILYVGTIFFQGYFYTEPSAQVYWQAPAAGAVLTAFLVLWGVTVVNSDKVSPIDIPYDTLFRFSPQVDLLSDPAREIVVSYADGSVAKYLYRKAHNQRGVIYFDANAAPMTRVSKAIVSIDMDAEGKKIVAAKPTIQFKPLPKEQQNESFKFVYRSDDGWTMIDYGDGPTGLPRQFRMSRMAISLFFNLGHLLAWFLVLWLLLRFEWGHALGFALALWILLTLAMLPMILGHAASVGQQRQTAAAQTPG